MKISQALGEISLLGIETAPFIYFVEENATYIQRMDAIFNHVNAGIQVITSVVTLAEVLVMPISEGQAAYERAYREMLLNTRQITSLPVSSRMAEQAARLRAKYRLRTPDALQIATAIEAGCDAFLTNDTSFRRVSEMRVLVLDDLTL